MSGEGTTWSSVLRRRARLLQRQILALQRLAQDSGVDEDKVERYCAPYYRMLDAIYEEDMPVARALDGSDLLLHLDGEGLQLKKSAALARHRHHGRRAQAGRHHDQDPRQLG